ncbi:hypothetical protein AAFF_G00168460 [Aldrovandia affinis]|uniref:Uncharacterized protein n=1 Tax=Aldrovandia affinis TaxID=143900 RepID=A0AAD7RLY2_9TELE|nr:hypothetical protein AAFF_G00168460 [Aldrovandia affinis]
MPTGGKGAPATETKGASGATVDVPRGRQTSVGNTEIALLEGERQAEARAGGFLLLPILMACDCAELGLPMQRHKSNTDIPYSTY